MTLPVSRPARWAIAAALALVAGVCGAVANSAAARTGPQLVPGRGTWLSGGTDFVGYYSALVGGRWLKVYCVSPDRREPTRVDLRTVSRVPSTSVRVTRELAETLSAHGDARTVIEAEAVSQALNIEIGNARAVARRARSLPRRVQQLADRYVAEAHRAHGPVRLTLHLPASPLPGQSGVGTVTLRAAGGPVPGVVVLHHTPNVDVPETVHVNQHGVGRFRYRTISGGPVHIAAAAHVVPTNVRAGRTDPATQLMLTWSPVATARAFASYQGSGPGFGHRYSCTGDCAGRPQVTLTACAPANRYPSRITFWLGERTSRVSFAAAATRSCKSWTGPIADGTPVSATWQYRTPNGWTNALPARGWFTVDCPAAPPVAVAVSYDCTDAVLSATLGRQRGGVLDPLHNGTRHRLHLVLSGAITDRIVVVPGATAPVRDYPARCGTHATVTLRAGVERSSGGLNYGLPVQVVLP